MEKLFLILIGAIAGALGMYLIARNSPQHFLKAKKFIDEIALTSQTTAIRLKERLGVK